MAVTFRFPGPWLAGFLALALVGCGARQRAPAASRQQPPASPAARQSAPPPDRPAAAARKPSTPALPPVSRAQVPAGFRIGLVAAGLPGVRMMAFSPDGRLFATQPVDGRVLVVPIGSGKPTAWASGLDRPHGIAFHGGSLYVADTNEVLRWPYKSGSASAPGKPEHVASLPAGGEHWTRTIAFAPDGSLFISVGSSCNACIESDPRRAAILRIGPAGDKPEIYATGLRNAVGLALDSRGRLWATVNGRDYLGNDIPPDALDLIRKGGFYGWPYAYGNRVPDPDLGSRRPDLVRSMIPPTFALPAHVAPLGLAFYEAGQFPAQYRGDALIALHGSWNRTTPVGYKVVRVHFEGGMPKGMSDFVTGFGLGNSAWARPVGVVVGPDGSLFVSDDKGGRIFRVSYGGG